MRSLGWWGLRLRAVALLFFNRRREAEAVFGRLLALRPDDPYALASRAHVRAQLGRRAEAIADARRLVAVHPRRSAGDWFNLAYLLEQDGDLSSAEAAFRRALELDDRLDRAWYGLGLTLICQQRLDEAVEALKRNTELQPMSPYGWYQLARVHLDRQQPDEARRIIRHLRGFEPKVAAQLERETGMAP
ncbi:tetratricopeptide repeat protein [Aquabacterium sp. J223]|uniref:tetratricopeptide repeat protein n=1 Tax=Aquabacterium sp. J223 TaxID=2898431 RepID=UPI0021AD8C0D|nr:tetratricopeptide repeat protein [Aquabacterium sp. J223]UUX94061.1 tetratricopeptide repeat protein [Aquabacterium sp. J223]